MFIIGAYERNVENTVAGVRLQAPMMNIHTIAAGGGSICRFDGARFRVGPESAGADPGPACYRRNGPLTVTDCNVMLGKLHPSFFPAVFGPDGTQPLDTHVVTQAFARLADEVEKATGLRREPREIAEGFLAIAVENVASAIKQISIAKGHDVTQYTLVCFGGAGGQHACLVADALGMKRVLIHPLAGVLSAYGIGLSEERVLRQRAVELVLGEELVPALNRTLDELEREARTHYESTHTTASASAPTRPHDIRIERRAHLKYQGTDTSIELPYGTPDSLRSRFEAAYLQRFTFTMPDRPLVVESLTVELIATPPENEVLSREEPRFPELRAATEVAPTGSAREAGAASGTDGSTDSAPVPFTHVDARFAGRDTQTPVYDRAGLSRGAQIPGPAIVFDSTSTTVIEPGWAAFVRAGGDLILERVEPLPGRSAPGTQVDPVQLEIFNNLFMSIAEQMGVALQSTAYSVNIKERLDFSCALFDSEGALIANAPHMPVHLGSMGESVRSLIAARGSKRDGRGMLRGDVYALNNPYNGGTHLPDVTVVMPVFAETSDEVLFFVAARGHHADIGGKTPGSMPPDSTTLAEEGVLIDNFLLVERGTFREQPFRELLTSGPWPARNIEQNIGDIKAQVAACARGAQELMRIVREYGQDVVLAYMHHVRDNAAESVRRMLDRLDSGTFSCESDDGSRIVVSIRVDKQARRATIDFTGTSEQQPTNFNAPSSITRAAVLYVMRTLVDDEIPMNEGCLEPIDLIVPEGCLLAPRAPAAVVAGNVETSQLVTDALFGATGRLAASQGTMNNFTFGNRTYQYYETLCGGSGAGPGFDGTDAVQTHMTNSRLTDPEVLEWRFPVLVDTFAIRRGSGGTGRYRGGNGVVRRIRFLEPMTASILSNRRRVAPFGLSGGSSAAPGRNAVIRADGTRIDLPARASVQMNPGDVFEIETPGGGGYGTPAAPRAAT
jgi:5-oxoprolinase (ATP-hydrolysing)